jgi:hypothetical protein
MTNNEPEWQKLQRALEDAFAHPHTNVVGGKHLQPLMDAEDIFGNIITQTFRGFRILQDSFQDFFLETEMMARNRVSNMQNAGHRHYIYTVFLFRSLLRIIRAADRVACSGYPLKGFALLRSAREEALVLGAIVGGTANVPEAVGYKDNGSAQGVTTLQLQSREETGRRHKQAESYRRKIISQMIGPGSQLPKPELDLLGELREIFDYELHYGRLSYWLDVEALIHTGRMPSMEPTSGKDDLNVAIFLNRMTEITWLCHRCLPFLQSGPRAFGIDWVKRWELLDKAFTGHVGSLSQKVVIGAFFRYVQLMFPFDPDTH